MQPLIEPIIEGLSIEYHPHDLVIYHLSNMRRMTIDAWVETVQQHDQEAAAAGRNLYRLLDLREAGYLTPYASTRAIWVATIAPSDLIESMAILVADTLALQHVRIVTNRLPSRSGSAVKLFTDENAALMWLEERRALLNN